MKKIISVLLAAILLSSAFAVQVNAVETEKADDTQLYYDEFINYLWPDYDEHKAFYDEIKKYTYYKEVYRHDTNGAEDWVLISAYGGMNLEELTAHILFGMAFSNPSIMVPFTYGYGVYNVSENKFYDLPEIKDETKFPGIGEALEKCGIGIKLEEPVFGDNLICKDEFIKKANKELFNNSNYPGEKLIKYYDELSHHYTDGKLDWVLVNAEYYLDYLNADMRSKTRYYNFGDCVIKNEHHMSKPFYNTYGVYVPSEKIFYSLDNRLLKSPEKFPELEETVYRLKLGRLMYEQESNSNEVFFAYQKKNLGENFPLVQKTSSGNYNLYAVCVPFYGNSNNFGLDENGTPLKIKCELLFENDDYLYFSADISKAGVMEPGADYILQFSSGAMTWNLTMTKECLGDTVVMTGESVSDSDMETYYFVEWKNNPQCGMQARLLPSNTLWCAGKGCTYLPVHCPKAAFVSDALGKYLLTSYQLKDAVKANLNASFADAGKNRANCEALGINPVDVYAQYADDNSAALINGEPRQLELNSQEVSAVLYNGRYYADLEYIARVLGLTEAEIQAYNEKENAEIGDVNNDGVVNIADATTVQKSVAKLAALNYRMLLRADFNRNGKVDIDDATCIQKRAAKLI